MSVPDAQHAPEVNLEARPRLPRLILIADRFTDPDLAQRVLDAVQAGLPWVHLRDHAAGEDVFRDVARALVRAIRDSAPEVLVSINGRLAVARELCTGFHTGAHGPSIHEAGARQIGVRFPVGYSAHTAEEAHSAVAAGADYLVFSPIFPTTSKPGQPGVGRDGLRALTREVREAPVYALGGITPERVGRCIRAGAYGVAVLAGILHTEDPASAVRAYIDALLNHEV